MGLFSPLHCSANHRAGFHLRFFGAVTCTWIGGVPSQRFLLRFWALEGDVSRSLPPKKLQLQREIVHADSLNPEPGWHHSWIPKNALTSDWCQSSGTNGIKLCLLDVKPQSFLFTQWNLQFIKASGLSTTPCPTISSCFLFWKMSVRRFSSQAHFLLSKGEHLVQPPTAPSEETGD